MYQTATSDPIFKIILARFKKLIFLPHGIIQPYIEYLINELEKVGLSYPLFFNYLKNKMTPSYNARASYFSNILKSNDSFHSLTSNISENFHKNLNMFLFSINKSTDLNNILKRIQTYVLVDYRELERQLSIRKSDYQPCKLAVIRYTNAKKFTTLLSKIDFLKTNINLFKKINKLLDNFNN